MVRRWILATLLIAFSLACALVQNTATPNTPTLTLTEPATFAPTATTGSEPTPTSPPSATPTSEPTAAPTAMPSATVQVPENSVRVQFAPGATSWATEDALLRNQTRTYLVNAMQDQLMTVLVTSPLERVYITIVGLNDGVPLARAQMGATGWSGKLRATQDYAITVSTLDGAPARYTLNIIIPRRLKPDPERTVIEHQGHLEPFEVKEYALEVPAGQLLMVDILSQQLVGLTIVGHDDGNPYKRAVSEEPFWSGFVPTTQDYLIEAVAAGQAADYTLRVTLPREIRFDAGAVKKDIKATLPALDIHTYVLAANAGQHINLKLEANATAHLELYGYEDGQPLLRADAGETSWEGLLPATQHYIVEVVSRHDKAVTYTLKVEIK